MPVSQSNNIIGGVPFINFIALISVFHSLISNPFINKLQKD